MSSKSFMLALAVVLALGVAIGGAFVAGLVVGGSSDDTESTANVLTLPSPGGSGAASRTYGASSGDMQSPGQILQRVESGEMSQEEVRVLRRTLGEGFGGPGAVGAGGLTGRGVLIGTVESIGDGKITISTVQGPSVEANIVPETAILRPEVLTLTLDDLSEGLQVQVSGAPNEAGVVEAMSIFVVPEGDGGFGGLGGFGGRGTGSGEPGGGQ